MTYVEVGKFLVHLDPDDQKLIPFAANLRELMSKVPQIHRHTTVVTFEAADERHRYLELRMVKTMNCVVGFERP